MHAATRILHCICCCRGLHDQNLNCGCDAVIVPQGVTVVPGTVESAQTVISFLRTDLLRYHLQPSLKTCQESRADEDEDEDEDEDQDETKETGIAEKQQKKTKTKAKKEMHKDLIWALGEGITMEDVYTETELTPAAKRTLSRCHMMNWTQVRRRRRRRRCWIVVSVAMIDSVC